MSKNLCYNSNASCNACCGLHNLAISNSEKKVWLKENQRKFLKLDLTQASELVKFRKSGENAIKERLIDPSVYACPFLGMLRFDQAGCLLHPLGSPHPDIGFWEHPQNFSFYGEGICLSYDCIAKEEIWPKIFYSLNKSASKAYTYFVRSPNYGKLIGHTNLWRATWKLSTLNSFSNLSSRIKTKGMGFDENGLIWEVFFYYIAKLKLKSGCNSFENLQKLPENKNELAKFIFNILNKLIQE